MSSLYFNVCDETFGRITDPKPDYHPLFEYTPSEQIVVAVWYASGIIENSGFTGFFERDFPGDPNLRLVTDSFLSLGDIESTVAFGDAIDAIKPNGRTEDNREKRIELWQIQPKDRRDDIEKRFYNGMDELTLKLANHISETELLPPLENE